MLRLTSRRFCATVTGTATSAAAAAVGMHKAAPDVAAVTAVAPSTEEAVAESQKPALSAEEKAKIQEVLKAYGLERDGAVLDEDGLPPVPTPPRPYSPPMRFPFRPRKGIEMPEYYNSRSAIGHPDQLALTLTAGRSDPEWQWLKFLCFICVMSTMGTWVYGVFFPEQMKWFKDEPWSTFRN